MLTAPKAESKPRVLAPTGAHAARIVRLVQLGTAKVEVKNKDTGEKEIKHQPKIWLEVELVDKTHVFKEGEDPKPFVVGREFTFSMFKQAHLRSIVEGVIGAQLTDAEADTFDVEQLLGQACLVTLKKTTGKNGNEYVNLDSTAPLMEGMTVKKAYNPVTKLTFSEWNEDLFSMLPNFLRDKITASPEYAEMKNPKPKKVVKDMKPLEYPTEEVGNIPF